MTTLTDQGMQRSLAYSAGMHALLFALVIFGLPSFCQMEREAEPMIISMEIHPLGPKANIAPTSTPTKRPENAIKAPNVLPMQKPVMQDKPAPTPEKPKPPTVVEKEEAPAPEEPKPTPPKEEPKPAPDKPAPDKPKEQEKPKEATKKPVEKPKEKQEDEMTLDDVLKNLDKSTPDAAASPSQSQNAVESRSTSTSWDPNSPQAQALAGFIYQQIQPHWSPPIGAANAYEYKVLIKVKLQPNGQVVDVRSATSPRDAVHQSFIESAMRAVWKASPLKNLPADQYNGWKDVTIQFDPANLY